MSELDKVKRMKSTQASKYPIQQRDKDDVFEFLKTQLLEHNRRSIMRCLTKKSAVKEFTCLYFEEFWEQDPPSRIASLNGSKMSDSLAFWYIGQGPLYSHSKRVSLIGKINLSDQTLRILSMTIPKCTIWQTPLSTQEKKTWFAFS